MAIISAYLYREGVCTAEVSLDEAPPPARPGDFVWVGLFEPAEQELRALQASYGLHPLAVEDALKAHEQPKVEIFGDQLFVVARTAQLEGDRIAYGETAIFVGHNHIITVRHGSARAHTELRAQLESAPGLLRHGVDYVLHALLDFIVDGYDPIIEEIEEEVLLMEKRTIDTSLTRDEVIRLFSLRRQTVRFQRVLRPMIEVVSRLVHLSLPYLDPEVSPYFRDVLDHLRRTQSTAESLRDILTSVFEVSNLLEQQRQVTITRQLAAWAAILAMPTAIAGIYGMNFANMPELETRFGYYVVLIVIAAAFTCASRSPDGCRRGTARLRPALSQACCGPSPR
ncbi:magnesium and cobalt transport protein CorA [Paracoccus sp. M683]|uniref:magnesium and cobalt transport protein CorA n=1 Tax=Paracoccus sp. M683 TaxID=2594268 RepID=UPI00117BF2EB|nr:magnesium and cobalt transport protein CorA [Paracoccus sp. M683]TRW95628.1 magnesium and cobalt transport protein CorA [Paracoccus sp. M683]